jgi:hypothetical protein
MKREGVRAGVPDLHLPVARGVYHSLYIEMKTCAGRLSSSQREWRERLLSEGNAYVVCRTTDEGMLTLREYLSLAKGQSMPGEYMRTGALPLCVRSLAA